MARLGPRPTITIELKPHDLRVDGLDIAYHQIPEIIFTITRPDPRKWYRFERNGDIINVYVKISEEEKHGTGLATVGNAGSSEADPGGKGKETPHP